MAQCQTNPEGRCTMEPPCPTGECYLYAVLSKEHTEETRTVIEDLSVAKALVAGELRYNRGPYTEKEPWNRSKLDLVNALIDTLVPGARLVVEPDEQTGAPARVYLGRTYIFDRPRDLAASLRELADCLTPGQKGAH